jgi:hypothetical protein
MSRHEIANDKGQWVFGWDQPMLTFFLQLHKPDLDEGNPVIWLGTSLHEIYEVDDLVRKARKNGLEIPYSDQVTLYGDKDEGR